MNESAASSVIALRSKYTLTKMQHASKFLRELNVLHERRVVPAKRPLQSMASLIVCLCAFSLMMPPQVTTLVSLDSAESQDPAEEDGESTERELVDNSSRRRCEKHRSHRLLFRASKTVHIYRAVSYKAPALVRTGHQLANGLAAPLLI